MARNWTLTIEGTSRAFTVATGVGPRGATGATGAAGADGADGATWEAKSSSFTAAGSGMYVAVATLTVTDPSPPAEGMAFEVFVRNGTATIGGTAYATAGTLVTRVYHSGAWANYVYQVAGTFAAASHTHLSADITDASTGGNGASDSGKVAVFDQNGGILSAPVFDPSITTLTGGGATALDGLTTNGVAVGRIQCVSIDGSLSFYVLINSTFGESSPTYIRPDDFAPSTNEKAWYLMGVFSGQSTNVIDTLGFSSSTPGVTTSTYSNANVTEGRTWNNPNADGTLALTAQTDGTIRATDLDFANTTDIGADLADADEILVSDGGGNTTRRKSALSRLWTYVSGKGDSRYPRVIYSSAVKVARSASVGSETLATVTIPGGTLGPNGYLELRCLITGLNTATAGTRTNIIAFGGTTIKQHTSTAGTNFNLSQLLVVQNRNDQSAQITSSRVDRADFNWGQFVGVGSGGDAGSMALTVDTSADFDITISNTSIDASDTCFLQFLQIITHYKA